MGANYLSLEFKNVKLTEDRVKQLRADIDQLTEADIPEIARSSELDTWREGLHWALSELLEIDDSCRDVAYTVDGKYMQTGGMSWSDDPTEVYTVFKTLYESDKLISRIDQYFDEDYPPAPTNVSVGNLGGKCELHTYDNRELSAIDQAYIAAAKQNHAIDGEIEVDDVAIVSHSEERGAYVSAWLWIDSDEVDGDSDDDADDNADDDDVEAAAATTAEVPHRGKWLDVARINVQEPLVASQYSTRSTDETVIKLANGKTISSGWIDKDDPSALLDGDYFRVDSADGEQLFYVESDQIATDVTICRKVLSDLLQACK